MKKIKRGLGQNKNEINQLEFEADKKMVAGTGATFTVKYLGSIEVRDARGVNVCMKATAKLYKTAGKNKKKTSIVISMDGVRVVDNLSRVLLIDQPIEKISFCSPDPTNKYMFSYIARDGASRRWLCHGFIAVDELGERLSHALGCAFTACLQRKQRSQKNSPPKQTDPTVTVQVTEEIKVPVSDKLDTPTQILRDRSSTAIGISTPPNNSQISSRLDSSSPDLLVKPDTTNPFGDTFDPGETFCANLADILLFDVNCEPSLLEVENRDRSASDQPFRGNVFDEFDPLNKNLSFEDDFIPPVLSALNNTLDTHSTTLRHHAYNSHTLPQQNSDNNPNIHNNGINSQTLPQNGFNTDQNNTFGIDPNNGYMNNNCIPVISINDDKKTNSDYYNSYYQTPTLSNTNPFNDHCNVQSLDVTNDVVTCLSHVTNDVDDEFESFANLRNKS